MPRTPDPEELPAEDAKLVTLAKAARSRTGGAAAAAVRDVDGRTYVAAAVDLPSLRLSALQAAIAAAVSSGAAPLVVACLVAAAPDALDPADRALLADVGNVRLLVVDPDGASRS